MVPKTRFAATALVALACGGTAAAVAAGAEPQPPTDAELSKFIAIEESLAGDAAGAAGICATIAEEGARDDGDDWDGAAIGRMLDSHPVVSPHLHRHGLAGRRYAEISIQVAVVLIGAAIADDADAAARAQGKAGDNREALLGSTPSARPILARQAELTSALAKLEALCDGGDDEEPEDDGEDEGESGARR